MIFSLFDFKKQIRKEEGQKVWDKEHYKKVNYKNKEANQKNKEHIYNL